MSRREWLTDTEPPAWARSKRIALTAAPAIWVFLLAWAVASPVTRSENP